MSPAPIATAGKDDAPTVEQSTCFTARPGGPKSYLVKQQRVENSCVKYIVPNRKGGGSAQGLALLYFPWLTSPGSPTAPVMVIVIVPELRPSPPVIFPVILPAGAAAVGGLEASISPRVPPWSEVPANKISAKSEAKHRKRSVLTAVQSIPQTPLDNHKPHMVAFF